MKLHFNLPDDKEEVLKNWVTNKMAIAFQMFKKNLNKDYIKKGLTSHFEQNFKKQHPFWDAFVQYKFSRIARSKQDGTKRI